MTNIFTLDNYDNLTDKINIDELYEKKHQDDLKQLELFKKILNRVHVRIKLTARQRQADKVCWFIVPEIIMGVSKYDHGACIAYIMSMLKDNGFRVRYFHPNTLFISWVHWIPHYVRDELKKKTGIIVNEYGERIDKKDEDEDGENPFIHDNQMNPNGQNGQGQDGQGQNSQNGQNKKYTPISSYKPSGKLVYSEELMNNIGNKLKR